MSVSGGLSLETTLGELWTCWRNKECSVTVTRCSLTADDLARSPWINEHLASLLRDGSMHGVGLTMLRNMAILNQQKISIGSQQASGFGECGGTQVVRAARGAGLFQKSNLLELHMHNAGGPGGLRPRQGLEQRHLADHPGRVGRLRACAVRSHAATFSKKLQTTS